MNHSKKRRSGPNMERENRRTMLLVLVRCKGVRFLHKLFHFRLSKPMPASLPHEFGLHTSTGLTSTVKNPAKNRLNLMLTGLRTRFNQLTINSAGKLTAVEGIPLSALTRSRSRTPGGGQHACRDRSQFNVRKGLSRASSLDQFSTFGLRTLLNSRSFAVTSTASNARACTATRNRLARLRCQQPQVLRESRHIRRLRAHPMREFSKYRGSPRSAQSVFEISFLCNRSAARPL